MSGVVVRSVEWKPGRQPPYQSYRTNGG